MGRPKAVVKPIQGERLKSLCESAGISQKELANQIPISEQTISKIINGKCNLTENLAQRIVDVVPGFCSVAWLLGLSELKDEQRQFSEALRESLKESILLRDGFAGCALLAGVVVLPPEYGIDGSEIDVSFHLVKDGKEINFDEAGLHINHIILPCLPLRSSGMLDKLLEIMKKEGE